MDVALKQVTLADLLKVCKCVATFTEEVDIGQFKPGCNQGLVLDKAKAMMEIHCLIMPVADRALCAQAPFRYYYTYVVEFQGQVWPLYRATTREERPAQGWQMRLHGDFKWNPHELQHQVIIDGEPVTVTHIKYLAIQNLLGRKVDDA